MKMDIEDNSTGNLTYEFSDITQRAIVASVILAICLVGILGNIMVILAVGLSKKLRTATNVFVVNLSSADLLTCLVLPLNAVALLNTDGLPVSEWFCKVVAIVQFTTVGCSICTLASIAVNRLLLITRPNTTYRKVYTPRKIPVMLLFTWLFPLVVSIAPPLVDIGAVGYNSVYHFCGSISSDPHYTTYNLILATTLYPIPTIIIAVSYPLIWRHLHRHAKKLDNASNVPKESSKDGRYSMTMQSITENVASGGQPQIRPRSNTSSPSRKRKRQTEVTKNMLYVVCGFGLCLTPYAFTLVFFDNSPGIPYTTTILLLNNCINPFIYATKHRDFQTVFGCILRRKWDKIPNPSFFLKTVRRVTAH